MTSYVERLTVPWWAWPAMLAATAMLAAELAIGEFALRTPLTFVVAAALAVLFLAYVGRIRIRVVDGSLRVDDAVLDLGVVATVTVLDVEGKRDLLGVAAEPLAFVIQRPWVGGGVRIELADPDDPTPYWFVSSRHPQDLAAAIEAARVRTTTTG